MDVNFIDFLVGLLGIACYVSIPALLLGAGFAVGRHNEQRHLQSLDAREKAIADMILSDVRTFPGGADPSQRAALVLGQVVIASDYFKSFVAGLKRIVGGELGTYESLLVRARREALLRLCEDARARGYNAVCNIRYDTTSINEVTGAKTAAMVEIMAAGTAYRIP